MNYTEGVIIWVNSCKFYQRSNRFHTSSAFEKFHVCPHKNYGIYNLPDNFDDQCTYSGLAGREAFSPTDKDRKPVVRIVVLTLIICVFFLTLHFQPLLISDAGFASEEHTVLTEDGYLLTVHRSFVQGIVNFTDVLLCMHNKKSKIRLLELSPSEIFFGRPTFFDENVAQNCWTWRGS